MFLVALCLCTVLHVVLSDNATSCASGFRYTNSGNPINVTESCNEKTPCIGKCCPANQVLVLNKCVDNTILTHAYNLTNLDDYSEIEFYKSDVVHYVKKSTKKMQHFIQLYNEDFRDGGCFLDVTYSFKLPAHQLYLLENGSAVVRRLNTMKQWILDTPPGQFCVERQIELGHVTVSKPELVIRMRMTGGEDQNPDTATRNKVLAFGLVLSSVFLALVLAVYGVLPQLRNMAGMILMAYMATLMTAFILRAVQVLAPDNNLVTKNGCMYLGLVAIYTLVASFTWMNVMSFDIWWSMRGFRKLRQIHRRGVLVKLGWYALYGWGAPLILVIFMIVVENLDLSHMPDFIKSQYSDPVKCFIEDELIIIYQFAPILITTCINLMLFLMTAYNIWRIKRGVAQHSAGDSRRNKSDETRFGFYLKLSLVMGINWILELVSLYCEPLSVWWYTPDVFNSLTGLFIFIIFICKRSIIVLLCKRFSIGHELVRKWHHEDSKCINSARSNGKDSRKKLESVTDTSDDYEHEKSYKQ